MTTNNFASTGTKVVADVTVQSCAPATGRQGNAQWQISAEVPWSRYPERFWVDAVAGSVPVTPGIHHCAFTVGTQKDNTTGTAAFHYRFRLEVIDYVGGGYPDVMSLSFGSANGPASGDTGAPGSAPGSAPMNHTSDRELSIIRQSSIKAVVEARIAAYNNATTLVIQGQLPLEELSNHAEIMVHDIVGGMEPWVQQVVDIVLDPPMPPPEVPPTPEPVPAPVPAPVPTPATQQPIFEETV